jgi:DHA1 family bicyclomycin/chloramphenicol resistance-like MFS transporter
LLVGPWSDRVGRRLPLIIATSVHVLVSLAIALSPNIEWLNVFRVLQGFGAAGGGVVAAAAVRDLFGGYPLVRMLSRLARVSGLAGYGLVVVIASVMLIVETLPPERRREAGHSTAKARYHALFTDRSFIGIAIVGGMVFTGLFAYLSSSSFLFQDRYGFTQQQYGLLFAINSVGIIVDVGLWGILIPLWLFIAACGFCFPCVQVLALAHHGKEAGTAASLLGAVNFGLAGLISPVIGLFGISSAIPMGVMMVCVSVVAILALWILVRPRTVPALGH